jgi:DNA polymerase-3 subunit epsilon
MIHIGIDVETVNHQSSICEFAAIGVNDAGTVVFQVDELVDPGPVEWHPAVTKVHGISKRQVCGKPTMMIVWKRFVGQIEQLGAQPYRLVAHNAAFERRVLGGAVGPQWTVPEIECTLEMARYSLPDLPNHQLPVVAARLGLTLEQHHRAGPDALACASIARILAHPPFPVFPVTASGGRAAEPRRRGRPPKTWTANGDRGSNPEIRDRVSQTGSRLAGETVVFTGTLTCGWKRAQAKEKVVAEGGDVMDAVGPATTLVVVGGTAGQLTAKDCKTGKAREGLTRGCRVVSETEFLVMIGENS